MNKLHEAYIQLDLPPGSDMQAVNKKYKFLSTVWHPDRMVNDNFKKNAEEKLKQINNARDVLKSHFQNGHSGPSCACQASHEDRARDSSHEKNQSSRQGSRAATAEEEQAKKRDNERRTRAEEPGDTGSTANSAQLNSEDDNSEYAFDRARKIEQHEKGLKTTKISLAAFLVSIGFFFMSHGLVDWCCSLFQKTESSELHEYCDLERKFIAEKQSYLRSRLGNSISQTQAASFIPPYKDSYEVLYRRNYR